MMNAEAIAEAPSRPATGPTTHRTMDHTITSDDAHTQGTVNTAKRRSTHIRLPVELAERLERMAREMLQAHAEGRIALPSAMCERVPLWLVIERALDEQEARRARSNRSRPRR